MFRVLVNRVGRALQRVVLHGGVPDSLSTGLFLVPSSRARDMHLIHTHIYFHRRGHLHRHS